MVRATYVATLAVAFMSYIYLELSATKAVSSDARRNPAAPIPCSRTSVNKIPPADTVHAPCAHCCTHIPDRVPTTARVPVGGAGETPARLNETALHPDSCVVCSPAHHGMSVPSVALWHQCAETSSRLPCATRNPFCDSGMCWLLREAVVLSTAPRLAQPTGRAHLRLRALLARLKASHA